MAARGARSRKVVERQIKKEERKQSSKDHVSDLSHLPKQSLSPGRAPSRALTSSLQEKSVRKPGYSPSLGSIGSGESIGGSHGSNETQSKKYTVKGKETRAPRGRMGGVPTKTSERGRATPSVHAVGSSRPLQKSRAGSSSTTPGSRGNTADSYSWNSFKAWTGPGHSQPYRGLEDDPDMWVPSGDCLVYFLEETNYDDPKPSLRVHVSTLEQANSAFLSNLIRYGELIQNDEDHPNNAFQARESVLYNSIQPFTRFDPRSAHDDAILPAPVTLGTGSLLRNAEPSFHSSMDGRVDSHRGAASSTASRSDFDAATVVDGYRGDLPEPEITHELWLKAPSHITARAIQRRYNVATRNFFAMLYGKPLVGTDIFEMLGDLQNVTDTFYELNEPEDRRDAAQDIIYYLTERKLDDVRNNLRHALRLLHWCESQLVRWEDGYTECFIHCVGMMNASTFEMFEFRELSKQSRSNLENAYSELQIRILDAQERLQNFNFRDIWDVNGVISNSPVQRSFDAFRDFVYRYYARKHGAWPPSSLQNIRGGQQQAWLTRGLAMRLQDDFGAVYDYLVDRDVVFDANEARSTRKWEIISRERLPAGFSADSPGLPLTDMLVTFDSKHKYQHIPHPFPLLPQPQAPLPTAKPVEEKKKGLFGKLQKKSASTASQPDPKETFQTSLAFNGATNINRPGLPPRLSSNAFIDALTMHEKSLPLAIATPRMARLGRWVFLYGILQVLSNVSLDTEGMRFKDDIQYFVCPKLEGCPPWLNIHQYEEGPRYVPWSQARSYCFTAPERWGEAANIATPPAYDGHNPRASYLEIDDNPEPINELDGTQTAFPTRGISRMAFRGEMQTGPNSIGVALFPDVSDLKIDDSEMELERGSGRGNLKVPGGLMKPQLPMQSSRRPMSPVSPDMGAIDDRWRLEPGRYGRI